MDVSVTPGLRTSVDRRRDVRQRTLLAGHVTYGDPAMTIACGVRNVSQSGALIELAGPVLLPPNVLLLMAREGVVYDAKIMWRRGARVGVALGDRHDLRAVVEPQVKVLQAIWKEMALR